MAIYNGTYDKATKSFTFNGIPNGKYIAVIDYTTEYGDKFNLSRGQITVKGGANVSSDMVIDKSVITYPVLGVELNQETADMYIVDTEGIQLIATFIPSNATNQSVTWESSDPNVATVDQNGKVVPVDMGTTTITVRTAEGDKSATCVITILPVEVTDVSLNQHQLDLYSTPLCTDEYDLSYIITPSNATNQSVTWESSEPRLVSVDNGKITLDTTNNDLSSREKCTASVTVRTENGISATCSILNITSIYISEPEDIDEYNNVLNQNTCSTRDPEYYLIAPMNSRVPLKVKAQIGYSPFTPAFKDIRTIPLDPSMATIDSNTLITGDSVGQTTIRVGPADSKNTPFTMTPMIFPNKFRSEIFLWDSNTTKKNILEIDEIRNGDIVPVIVAARINISLADPKIVHNLRSIFSTPEGSDKFEISVGRPDISNNSFIFDIDDNKLPRFQIRKYVPEEDMGITTAGNGVDVVRLMILLKYVGSVEEYHGHYIDPFSEGFTIDMTNLRNEATNLNLSTNTGTAYWFINVADTDFSITFKSKATMDDDGYQILEDGTRKVHSINTAYMAENIQHLFDWFINA